MAFHVGVATVQRHKEKDAVSFAVLIEHHAITAESGGTPVFHRVYIPGFFAWRNPVGGAITIRLPGPRTSSDPVFDVSDAMKQSIIACHGQLAQRNNSMKIRLLVYIALVLGAITIGLTATTPRTTEDVAMCCDPVPICPGAPGCPDEPPPNQSGGGGN